MSQNSIHVASLNKNKINAVKKAFPDYLITGIACDSGVSNQPLDINEITLGAVNRAKSVFQDCEYSVGIEDGLFKVPNTGSGYMNVCCCAIYDGKNTYLGMGPAFEIPIECVKKILNDGMDL